MANDYSAQYGQGSTFTVGHGSTANTQQNRQVLEGDSHNIEIFPVSTLYKMYSYVKGKSKFDQIRFANDGREIVSDAITVVKIFKDLGIKGNYYVKNIRGTDHIVFKGYANRAIFDSTKYGVKNPKIVNLGIGKVGHTGYLVKGCKIAFIVNATINISEFLLEDDYRLSDLIGNTSTDLLKTVIGAVASYAAYAAVTAVCGSVLAPVIASIAVGVLVGVGLDYLDEKFNATENLINNLDRIGKAASKYGETAIYVISEEFTNIQKYSENTYHMMSDTILVTYDKAVEVTSKKVDELVDMTNTAVDNFGFGLNAINQIIDDTIYGFALNKS